MIQKIRKQFSGEGYQARAFRSTLMVLISFGGENILRLLTNLILARILFPEAFGLMALVQVVVAGAVMFSDIGFRSVIVQHERGEEPAFLNTTWSLQICRGILLTIVIMLLSGPAATFYEEPLLGEILMLAAFVPFLKSLESTKMLTANRTLQIERVTYITLGSNLIGSVVTIILAFIMGSVWALAVGLLVAPGLLALASHFVLHGHSNRPGFDKTALWQLLSFGGFIFLSSAASFFAVHGDRAVLGKYVTLEDLGFYGIGVALARLPRRLAEAIAARVIFPVYARRPPAESESNRRKINKARIAVTGPLVLLTIVFALFGDQLIRILYDPRYYAAGPYLMLIALAVIPEVITQSYIRLPLASGKSAQFAFYQITLAGVRFLLLILLVPLYGIVGAVITAALSTLLLYPLLLYLIRPYKAWDPVHDSLFLILWGLLSAGVLWYHWALLEPVFTASGLI